MARNNTWYWPHGDTACDPQLEVEEEGVRHSVTPLWCAAVSGRLAVVRQLPLSHQHELYQNFCTFDSDSPS